MPSVVGTNAIADSTVSIKEQVDSKNVSGDVGGRDDRAELEITPEASLKSPVTPAPANEPDGTPALRWKSYSVNQREPSDHGSGKPAVDGKGKLVINLCGIPRSLMKVESPRQGKASSIDAQGQAMVGSETLPVESAGALMQRNVPANQKKNGDKAAAISDFAKKVRLRVKRVRRSAKPNLFQRRDTDSEAKEKTSDTKHSAPKKGPLAEQETCDEAPDDEPASGRIGFQVHEVLSAEDALLNPSRSNVAEEKCGIDDMEDGEIEALKDADYHSLKGNASLDSISEHVPLGSSTATESVGLAQAEDACGINREYSIAQAAALERRHDPTLKGASRERTSKVITEGPLDSYGVEGLPTENRAKSCNDHEFSSRELSWKDYREYSTCGRRPRARSLSESVQNGGAVSAETSKLDMKECTILETLLPDEPPGFSFDGGSDGGSDHDSGRGNCRTSGQEFERGADSYHSQIGESESGDAESRQSEGSEDADSGSSRSQESGRVHTGNPVKCFSPGTPGRGAQFTDQVPSVLCDAEGNVWHIGKRAEQARDNEDGQIPSPPNTIPNTAFKEILTSAHDCQPGEVQECDVKNLAVSGCAPFSHLIQLNYKWPSDADYTTGSEVSNNRIMVVKERSIFVGCIPDGVVNLEYLLQSLMEKFLERFDFTPARLSRIQVVKAVKDFAFIELAADKVAQIVLAANQLDVFEWGVNGYHFNIQGCTATHTSVRPLIEYMPLRPARVIFVGNIPKFRWQKEYLEAFFSRILQGSDGPTDLKYVASVYLLPESSDAYVEMASELMADALIFKCTKSPELLKDVGEDVLICRDTSSVPLMSRHKGTVCPQRALFIGVPSRGEEFKIDSVVKVFVELLPYISRKSNQRGYLEYVCVKPGTDYAFFQFNSEAFVDAIMDEYIENTQIFLCRSSPVPYIILRPPDFVRSGARYRSGIGHQGLSRTKLKLPSKQASGTDVDRPRQARSVSSEQTGSTALIPRRFGDEPVKKPDCIVSIGVSPPPLATWNGLSASGVCSADPECMVVVEGLPKGLSYKLLRGALNELFERSLCHTGLLEVGMLVVRYLDRDGNFDAVASLPNADFVCALLSMRKAFVIAGEEIRLLPRDRRRSFHWRGNPADLSGGHCELSSLSDEDSQGRAVIRNRAVEEWSAPSFMQQRKRGHSETEGQYPPGFETAVRGSANRRINLDDGIDEWCRSEGWSVSPPAKQGFRGNPRESSQHWNAAKDQHQSCNVPFRSGNAFPRASEDLHCQGNNPRVRIPHVQNGSGLYSNDLRSEAVGSGQKKKFPEEVLRIVSREGKRIIQQVGSPSICETGVLTGMGRVSTRKRKQSDAGQGGPVHMVGFSLKKMRKHPHFPQ